MDKANGTEINLKNVNILLVDDRPENLYALEEILKQTGFSIYRASSCKDALKLLLEREYACCLLDIRMPDIDGFETAELIRGDEQLQNLPIIFVTAEAGDQRDMFKGYEKGAVDFLIKPLEPLIVRSKVKVFGELYLQRIALEQKREVEALNHKLSNLNAALTAANKDLEHFTHIAAHDLREPLRKQASLIDLLQIVLPVHLSNEANDLVERIKHSSSDMMSMVDDFRYLTKIGANDLKRVEINLNLLIKECLEKFSDQIKSRHVNVQINEIPESISVYPSLVKNLYVNLIANTFHHAASESFALTFTAEKLDGVFVLGVHNTHSHIPKDHIVNIFKIFRRGETKYREGSGLGLSICKKIIDRHNGQIYAESDDDSVHIKFSFGSALK